MSKKVLIIAYYFPPMPVIGAQRPYGLAKYLQNFGWEPTILTIKNSGNPPPGMRVITTDYTDRIASVKKMIGLNANTGIHQQLGITITKNFNYPTWKSKIIKFLREVVAFPDGERGWYKHAVNSASELLDKERVDAIISTSFPVTAHLIARKLKRKYEIPWVADLRDLWTQNPYYGTNNLIRPFERLLEMKTLSDADALVTVSEPLAETLKNLHANKDVICITNGYDPDDFNATTLSFAEKPANKFTITYTGKLYNGTRDPLMLFEVVAKLIREKKIDQDLIEMRFFCDRHEWLINDIKKYGLDNIVRLCGFVSREESIRRQKESQLLLILLWNDKKEVGAYTGKLFEYLGSRRPILALVGSENVMRDLLAATNSGRSASNKQQAETILMQYYREFIEFGEVKYQANETLLHEYSYDAIAGKYSMLLNKIAV